MAFKKVLIRSSTLQVVYRVEVEANAPEVEVVEREGSLILSHKM